MEIAPAIAPRPPQPEGQPPRRLGRRPVLDGLRGIAVLLVVLSHAGVLHNGSAGVDIFFGLSGFLITTLLCEEWERSGAINLARFYGRRARRLLPALLVLCAVTALLVLAGLPITRYPFSNYPPQLELTTTMLFLNNWVSFFYHAPRLGWLGPTWSLGQEEQFYLLWPVVLAVMLRANWRPAVKLVAIAVAIGLLCGLQAIVAHADPAANEYYSPFYRGGELLCGCAAALAWRHRLIFRSDTGTPAVSGAGSGMRAMRRRSAVTGRSAIAALLLLVLAVLLAWPAQRPLLQLEDRWLPLLTVLVAVPLMLALIEAPSSTIARLIGCPPLRFLGRISYSLYLYHLIWFELLYYYVPVLTRTHWALVLATFAGSIAMASLSWYLLEAPILAHGRSRSLVAFPLVELQLCRRVTDKLNMARRSRIAARPDTPQEPRRLGRRPVLDGLRGIAVLLVVCCHALIAHNGVIGVDIFFGLSGFLITTLLYEEWDRTGGISFRRFYERRARRLLPALLVLVLFNIYLGLVTSHHLDRYLPTTVLFLNNWYLFLHPNVLGWLAPTWTLAEEEQFYLLWPLALLVMLQAGMRPRQILAAVSVGILALLVIQTHFQQVYSAENNYFSPFDRGAELLFGCAASIAWRHRLLNDFEIPWLAGRARRLLPATVRRMAPAAVCAAGLGFVLAWNHSELNFGADQRAVHLLAALFAVPLIVTLIRNPATPIARAIASPPLRFLGKISYGLYLYNVAWFWALQGHFHWLDPVGWQICLMALTGSIAMATISWRLIESPIRNRAGRRGRPDAQPERQLATSLATGTVGPPRP